MIFALQDAVSDAKNCYYILQPTRSPYNSQAVETNIEMASILTNSQASPRGKHTEVKYSLE
jgi:hypothetical protein